MTDQTNSDGNKQEQTEPLTIDLSMSWGQVGRIYIGFAETRSVEPLRKMRSEVAKAFALAEAASALLPTLTEDQKTILAKTLTVELSKLGY